MSKPRCKLIGEDGNVFNLLGRASRALREAGQNEDAALMRDEIFNAKTYDEALRILMKYVEVE